MAVRRRSEKHVFKQNMAAESQKQQWRCRRMELREATMRKFQADLEDELINSALITSDENVPFRSSFWMPLRDALQNFESLYLNWISRYFQKSDEHSFPVAAKAKRSPMLSLRQNPHWSLLCRKKKARAVHDLHGIEEEPQNTNSVPNPRHAQDLTAAPNNSRSPTSTPRTSGKNSSPLPMILLRTSSHSFGRQSTSTASHPPVCLVPRPLSSDSSPPRSPMAARWVALEQAARQRGSGGQLYEAKYTIIGDQYEYTAGL